MDTSVDQLISSLKSSKIETAPFGHWLLEGIFTDEIYYKLINLPSYPPNINSFDGKRNSNKNQIFFNEVNCEKYDICGRIIDIFKSREVINYFEKMLDINLLNSYLRIGYYVDKNGFWLEPHTDLSVKLVTITIYLYKENPSEELGTNLFDHEKVNSIIAPSENNSGLIFIPASNTWHGFNKRKITGLRKTLVINYVTEKWLNKNELCCQIIY